MNELSTHIKPETERHLGMYTGHKQVYEYVQNRTIQS